MVPQDVPRPQVAVLQQRRYGAGSSECALETLQHVRGEADSAELPEGIRGSDAQGSGGGGGGGQEAGQQICGSPGDHARDREDLRHGLYPGELRQARQGALVEPTGNELVELQLNLAVSRTAGPGHDRAQLRVAIQRPQHRGLALQVRIGDGATLAEVARSVVPPEQHHVEPAVPDVAAAPADGGRDRSIVLHDQDPVLGDLPGQIPGAIRRHQELVELVFHT